MIVLGISGFEDIRGPSATRGPGRRANSVEELLSFREDYVPLQYFPLQLIGHDCSAALLIDGDLIAFAAEERFSRVKHGLNLAGKTVLPRSAISFCLSQSGITWNDIDYVAHFCDFNLPTIRNRIASISGGLAAGHHQLLACQCYDVYENCLAPEVLMRQLTKFSDVRIGRDKFVPVRHHLAHAAGAFYSSGFDDALILTVDGFGEEESSLVACGRGAKIELLDRVQLPTSLGLLYQVITTYLGFRSYGDEYKVMGLSSYGDRHRFRAAFREFIQLDNNGRYAMSRITSPELFQQLKNQFGVIEWENGFSQKAADIAAALQDALETALMHMLSYYQAQSATRKLCLSGGVALNATANGIIKRSGIFEQVYIQPAAADDGTSLGAALYVDRQMSRRRHNHPIEHAYWGPGYTSGQIENSLGRRAGIKWQIEKHIAATAARLLAEGKLVGWFQGRMEMGPRALGARSIVCDPRKRAYRDRLNSKIKNRELFRPFAPSVLEEEVGRFFALNGSAPDPYMITTVPVRVEMRHLIPAVVHVDGTSRLQTVSRSANARYHSLIKTFYELTGIPLILNTSFNRAGEPIVCSPEDALNCFLQCGLDALVMEDFLVFPSQPIGENA